MNVHDARVQGEAPRGCRWFVSALGGLLLAVLALATFWIWSQPAVPMLAQKPAAVAEHARHANWLLLNVATGTLPLVLGPLQLWSGPRRRWPQLHRWAGRTYLLVGGVGVVAGGVLSVVGSHPPASLFVATGVLAVVWLIVAALAYRAIRQQRSAEHRCWIVRSYLLTFSFVICRLVMRTDVADMLGSQGPALIVWSTWVVPLLLLELWLRTRGDVTPMARV